jgi:hypothetical protein
VDANRIAQLRSWGQGLEERGSNEETRAAGKAILMLVGEVEGLQARLDAAASAPTAPAAPVEQAEPAADETAAWAKADDRTSGSFWSRIKRTFGFES